MDSKAEALREKELGNKAYKAIDYTAAHLHYDKAIELDPGNIVFYTNKTAVLFQEERFDECVTLCEKAIDVGRSNSASSENLSKPIARIARVHMRRKEYAKAIEKFYLSLKEHHVNSVDKELSKSIELHVNSQEFGEESSVEVKESPVHGRGVFAARDIKKFELVCYYDGELKTKAQIMDDYRKTKIDKEYWMSHPTKPDTILCGYRIPQNKNGVGQLVNDAKILDIKELDFKKGIKDCEEYTVESKRLRNVSFMGHGKHFQLFAIKDIAKGDELFLHYGYKMWLQEFGEALEAEEYMWKCLFFALDGQATFSIKGGGLGVLKVEEVYEWSEGEAKGFIEIYLKMPSDTIEKYKQAPEFSYSDLVAFLMNQIEIDYVETSILDNDICN